VRTSNEKKHESKVKKNLFRLFFSSHDDEIVKSKQGEKSRADIDAFLIAHGKKKGKVSASIS
jgi:hypothetical protein